MSAGNEENQSDRRILSPSRDTVHPSSFRGPHLEDSIVNVTLRPSSVEATLVLQIMKKWIFGESRYGLAYRRGRAIHQGGTFPGGMNGFQSERGA